MRIARLRLSNWMCYSDVDLELEAKPYAVTARRGNDAERSNWLGKSSLFEAVRFALFGVHRFRTDDEWITRGEPAGYVEITFDNGVVVKRSKTRGKSTQLFVRSGERDGKGLTKDEAQRAIEETITGLGLRDFEATCYFEQRKMARLILTDPSDRTKIITAWLRLEPLREGEALLSRELKGVLESIDAERRNIDISNAVRKRALGDAESADALAASRGTLEADERAAEKEKRVATEAYAKGRERAKVLEDAERHAKVIVEGRDLKRRIQDIDEEALGAEMVSISRKYDEANARVEVAKEDVGRRKIVASGSFDGQCPVIPMDCPAKKKINEAREVARSAYEKARTELLVATDEATEVAEERGRISVKVAEASRLKDRLAALREREKELRPAAEAAKEEIDLHALKVAVDKANDRLGDLRVSLRYLDDRVNQARSAEEASAASVKTIELLEAKAATLREALIIFGRHGAQRRLAEGVLAEIEAGANAALADSGIDLRISLLWSREGQGFADACETCGHPFPASTKVKECTRCGEPRGAKIINRLEIDLSDRSGAAEDLAGGALQLAASAWLRADRRSAWNVALIDEPFGALDPAHRRTFGAHLAAMLSGRYGFEQAFVIAHHTSALDALPGRIEIVSDPTTRRSTAKVVA